MQFEIAFEGELVERQELLNGTETVSLEGVSDDGAWTLSGLLTWNIGLVSNTGEGDVTLARAADGAEIFATLLHGDVTEMTLSGDESADHAFRLEYEIDGGSEALVSASGQITASGSLAASSFRGRWVVALVE